MNRIVPFPARMEKKEGVFHAEEGEGFSLPDDLPVLASLVSARLGLAESACGRIRFAWDTALKAEAFTLDAAPEGISIRAGDEAGLLYAASALAQLLPDVPCCHMEDAPRFLWRGMHLDVCRHFFPVKLIEQVIDVLSFYRFNRLHLHLSDDQGFRVEIAGYPLLNEIGSFRKRTLVKRGRGAEWVETPYGGFYTKKQLAGLAAYGAARGVTVYPEIELPGHACAMIAAYPELSCSKAPLEVPGYFGVTDFSSRILCPGEPKVYDFLETVLGETAELFPAPYFHIGGDEAVKSEWKTCPACRALMQREGYHSPEELQGYLTSWAGRFLAGLNKRVIRWNDGLTGPAEPGSICQYWGLGARHPLKKAAQRAAEGETLVRSDFYHLYLDYPYAMTPLKKTYRFDAAGKLGRAAEQNLAGLESCLWTEWIEDADKLWFNLLPRLAAVAEAAWCEPAQKDFSGFAAALPAQYALYEAWGLPYAKGMETGRGLFGRAADCIRFFTRDTGVEVKRSGE